MLLKEFPLQELVMGYASLFGVHILITDNDRNAAFSSLSSSDFRGDTQGYQHRFTPLRREGQVVGMLLVASPGGGRLEEISQVVAMAVEAVLAAAEARSSPDPASLPREAYGAHLVQALLEGSRSREDILALAHRAELDEALLRSTICIELDYKINHYFNINLNLGYVSLLENLRAEILEKLRRNKYLNTQDFFGFYGTDRLVISKSFLPGADSSRIYLALDRICHQILEDLSQFQLLEARMAYGNLYGDLFSVRKSYDEAQEILTLGKLQDPDLGFYSIGGILLDNICRFLHPQIVNKIILPTLQQLCDEEGHFLYDLLRCGEVFVDHCMDYTAAAAAAYMHRNTLKTKLTRLTDLTGLHPTEDFTHALIIKLLAVYARQNQYSGPGTGP